MLTEKEVLEIAENIYDSDLKEKINNEFHSPGSEDDSVLESGNESKREFEVLVFKEL